MVAYFPPPPEPAVYGTPPTPNVYGQGDYYGSTNPWPVPTPRPISREMITAPRLRIRNPGEDKYLRKKQAKARRPSWRK